MLWAKESRPLLRCCYCSILLAHFVKRSEYMSISCFARSIGVGPAGASGSELPNQLILDKFIA